MYRAFYHLKASPFGLTPDTRFFFSSAGHKRVLSFLRYGIHKSEGFIIITGDVGTGKTTLIHTLLKELAEEKDMLTAQLAATQNDAEELLPMVTSAFGLDHEGLSKAGLWRQLEQYLITQASEGRRAVLIVDEAQNLSMGGLETLRLLVNYQINHRPLLQGFLVGQAEFRTLLESEQLEQLRQRIIASCHLGPMTLDETRQYIEHRLRIVDWSQDPSFRPEAYDAIYDYTAGVPRRINALCDRILLVGYLEELHEITAQVVASVVGELSEESFNVNGEMSAPNKTREKAVDTMDKPSGDHISQRPNLPSVSQEIQVLEKRLAAVEQVLVSSRLLEGGGTGSDSKEVEELRRQLAQVKAENKMLEERLMSQAAQAEQVRRALENEIENLLYRLSAAHDQEDHRQQKREAS